MQLYDLLYIIPAPNTEKDVEKIVKTIQKNIKELKGEIIKEDNLGNKKLAYPIEKKEKGFYISLKFKLDPNQLKTLDEELSSSNNVLRHMIVKFSDKPKKKKKRKIKKEEKQEKEEESNKKKKKKIKKKKKGKKKKQKKRMVMK